MGNLFFQLSILCTHRAPPHINFINRLFSSSPTQSVSALLGTSQYDTYATTLKWITETRRNLHELSDSDRADVFNIGPLLKETITPFLKNTILGSYHIETEDDKKHKTLIDAINQFFEDLEPSDEDGDKFVNELLKAYADSQVAVVRFCNDMYFHQEPIYLERQFCLNRCLQKSNHRYLRMQVLPCSQNPHNQDIVNISWIYLSNSI